MLAEFGPDTLKQRFTALMGIDVEMRFYGGSNASIVVINRPVNFNGYLVVQMAQQGVDIVSICLKFKFVCCAKSDSSWIHCTVLCTRSRASYLAFFMLRANEQGMHFNDYDNVDFTCDRIQSLSDPESPRLIHAEKWDHGAGPSGTPEYFDDLQHLAHHNQDAVDAQLRAWNCAPSKFPHNGKLHQSSLILL